MASFIKLSLLLIGGTGAACLLFRYGIPSEEVKIKALKEAPVRYIDRIEFSGPMKPIVVPSVSEKQNSISQQTQTIDQFNSITPAK